jgi:hypothetical protein
MIPSKSSPALHYRGYIPLIEEQAYYVDEIEYSDLDSTSREVNPLEFNQRRDAWTAFHLALFGLCRQYLDDHDEKERSEFRMTGPRGHSPDTDVK